MPLQTHATTAAPLTRDVQLHIVDDDAAVRSALKLLARVHGWQPRAYESGVEFLNGDLPAGPDACVVLDLNMPVLDGEEVLRRLRASGSTVPVLVISGDREASRMQRMLGNGAQGMLTKPFGDEAFYGAVEACFARETRLGTT